MSSPMLKLANSELELDEQGLGIRDITENYYDSDDANAFYSNIWGGKDIHIGLYDDTQDIRTASDATIDRMADALPTISSNTRVLDIGSGYGGAMRRIAGQFGCEATCLNLSKVQNTINRHNTQVAGLTDKVRVVHGTFEDIPEPNGSYDVVWSQDAILHSDQRGQVLAEVFRVLKPGGYFVFTDPCQADDVPDGVLQPVYDRLQLNSLGSLRFYRYTAEALGFDVVRQDDMLDHLRIHYDRVREDLIANYETLRKNGASTDYLDKMIVGLENWVKAADAGHLAWGIQLMRKPV